MKMRKFADEGFVREGKNERIDEETRARAMASVDEDRLGDFIKSRGLDSGSEAEPVRPVAAAPKAKPAIVTKEQLQAFKKQYGADKDLTDYMNAQLGRTRRGVPAAPVDTPVERGLPAMSAKERSTAIDQVPLDDKRTPVKGESASGSELGRNVKNTMNAMAGFKGVQLGQAAVEGLATPRAVAAAKELMRGKPAAEMRRIEPTMTSAAEKAKLAGELRRGATPTKFTSPSKSKANKDTRFREDAAGVEFRKGGSAKGYASGGAVSASRRGDGIAQRGKTRGKMC